MCHQGVAELGTRSEQTQIAKKAALTGCGQSRFEELR